jgi:predicted N-acetyltransferase YhbS
MIRPLCAKAFGSPIEARIVDALRGSAGGISFVATNGDCVVGHILFTPIHIEPPPAFELRAWRPLP